MERPPCWLRASLARMPAQQLRTRVIHNQTPLYGEWAGWRMAGRCLVSPDGDRISPESSGESCLLRLAAKESRNGAVEPLRLWQCFRPGNNSQALHSENIAVQGVEKNLSSAPAYGNPESALMHSTQISCSRASVWFICSLDRPISPS